MTAAFADVAPGQLDWLHALNESCTPGVGSMTKPELEALLAEAALARVVLGDEGPLGALIAFTRGAAYASPNYRWFCAREEPFLYIDRIMTVEAARSRGLGAALYADAAAWARARGLPRLVCEVNELPPNPRSMAFHERLGFARAGALDHPGGKRVVMLELRV